MSFYGFGGGGPPQSQTINPQTVAMAEQEFEMISDTLNRMMDSCFKKCVPNSYYEPDLNKGESVCVDRCVAKYWDVNMKVGEKFTAKMTGAQPGGGGGGPLG